MTCSKKPVAYKKLKLIYSFINNQNFSIKYDTIAPHAAKNSAQLIEFMHIYAGWLNKAGD